MFFLQREEEVELVINRSRFVGRSLEARSREEVKEKLHEVMELFPGATHYCYAFRIGEDTVEEFSSDAGEPPGSAGRPILGAIRRGDFTDTLVVVVRFFGGKKLGIRGLIDAYGKTAQLVLEKSGKKKHREIEFLVKINPVYFNLVVNQLVEVIQDRRLLSIYPDRGEVQFRISQSEETKIKEILQEGERTGKVLEGRKVK
ncbi:MAG TPA: YigZ family protein [Candidatus Atribacteria bacterium]|nr:YigZ family protein [Candidatus Atribacteria bacterium]